ncbi:heme-binding protein [bacterium]|nr:heme-binding protein [bacterium]MCI0605829.1 heme-binding protein [bacterium]
MKKHIFGSILALFCLASFVFGQGRGACTEVPNHAALNSALKKSVGVGDPKANGGFALNMWATVVGRDGTVCAVTHTGATWEDQWLASRVISAQKANTSNSLSLKGLALSTGNLYSLVQPGGPLFGLQFSNPVDTAAAYGGNSSNFGKANDPMVGKRIGGVNVFGGGLALYTKEGKQIGAIGVSGDTACADHNIAWKTRQALGLDNVPAGVNKKGDKTNDNIIYDITNGKSASGFGHPDCGLGEKTISDTF